MSPPIESRLLELYDRVADAPDAVEQLRKFVLDLAVRGRLVEQDPADESASKLLKRIEGERERLLKAGEIKKPKKLPPVEDEPYALPTNWCWVRIRQVTTDRGQKVPDSEFTYLDVTAINKEAGVVADPKVLSKDEAPSRARKIAAKGDVIYSCVRPYLLNVAVLDQDFDPEPIASTAFAVLNGHGFVLPWYLWIALRSPFMVERVEGSQRGQAYPAINDKDFSLLSLPLPPLAEQHRIVARADELMALLDRLETARTQRETTRDRLTTASLTHLTAPKTTVEDFPTHARFALDNLDQLTSRPEQIKILRHTILNLAVMGKLVEQDPRDEPAEELLKRIAAEKVQLVKAGKLKKQKQLPPISDNEKAFVLPRGWIWARLGDLSQFVTSGSRDWAKYYANEGAIFVRMGNLTKDHYRLRLDNIQRVKPPAEGEGTRTRLKGGDILISITGDVGMLGLIPEGFGEAYINQHTAMVRPNSETKGRYLPEFLRSPFAQYHFNAPQRGIKNSFRLNDVTELVVPLPPAAEQYRIVAKLDTLVFLCDQLEAAHINARATRVCLIGTLLNDALEQRACK